MKKLFAFLLTVCMLCSVMLLAGCDSAPGSEAPDGGNDLWKNAFVESDLNNVTLGMEITFDDGHAVTLEYKMFSDKILSDDGDIVDAESIATAKRVYMDMIKAVMDNKNKFQHDSSKNCYTTDKAITYQSGAMTFTANITMTNVVVTLDSNGKLASITCHMVQDISGNEPSYTLILDGTFTFSNYGTTQDK